MPDLKEIFEMVAVQIEPDQDSWKEQGGRQQRSARNRKLGALVLVAAIMVALALFAAKELIHSKASAPVAPPPVSGGSGLAFTVVGLDGKVRSSLPGLPIGTLHPDISPDGTTVAFTIQNGKVSQIATVRLDGSGYRVITSASIWADRPRWSPDGRTLSFYRADRKNNIRYLMAMNADGTNVREIPGTRNPGDVPTDWSPDGSLILYTTRVGGRRNLATVPAAGGLSLSLTSAGNVDKGPGTWSPDASLIAFTRTTSVRAEVWLMNADGSRQHRLAWLPGWDASAPEWSPDGRTIAFIGSDDGVYVVNVATGGVTEVMRGIASWSTYDSRATWLPDGNSLLVMTSTP